MPGVLRSISHDLAGRATDTDRKNLAGRVAALLLNPRAAWSRIDAAPATIGDLYLSHILPLAAIGPVAGLAGAQLHAPPPPPLAAAGAALAGYALTLAAFQLLALVMAALAPVFGAARDPLKAFQLIAYASTAAWLARIVLVWPVLPWLIPGMVASLYSVWLLWLGVPRLMRLSGGRAALFSLVAIAGALALNLGAALALRALFAG